MNERKFRRGLIGLAITAVILTSMVYIFPQSARGAIPTISYVSPSDGATFVDVIPGEGVNWTVNVTDSDGNLQRVRLLSNSSGSWQVFYDSGDLGTVSYHNASGTNPNWTGSWKTYYWRVACYDGTWTNYTYSFTTEYVFGQPHCIALDDDKVLTKSVLYKNKDGEYYLWFTQDTDDDILVKTSSSGTDFITKSPIKACDGGYVYNAFTYQGAPYVYYYASKQLRYLWYNKTAGAWQTGSTGISQAWYDTTWDVWRYHYGADVKYYDGRYQLVATSGKKIKHFTSDSPIGSFSSKADIMDFYTGDASISLNVLKGRLILTYLDSSAVSWSVYDGLGWTCKGDFTHNYVVYTVSTCRDHVNNQLVCVYAQWNESMNTDCLFYRVLNNVSKGWSDAHIIYKCQSGETIRHVHADYIDRRLVITFSSTIRGNYNIYVITAPDYVSVSGVDKKNRIYFPTVMPNQKHVNSTVIAIKNINDRPILNITWHVGNIGDIETANNVRVWSNMSGTWQSWLVGSDHNTTTIDISAYKGSEWLPGETLYWKIEIIDIGDVPEDIHTSDEDIWYRIDLLGS